MISFRQSLDYNLETGWLSPFVKGLQSGQAIARKCQFCSKVSFPPIRVCFCGEDAGDWITLQGPATVIWRTYGADGDFALVQFDGASTGSVVRLLELGAGETRGQIQASGTDKPALCLGPMPRRDKS